MTLYFRTQLSGSRENTIYFRDQLENTWFYKAGFLRCLRYIRDTVYPALKLYGMDLFLYSWPYLSSPLSKPKSAEIYRLR